MAEENTKTYILKIAYQGTAYSGWQIQPNGLSIQEVLQKNLSVLLREPTHVTGSGRTDAGVHACGQIAHFKTSVPIDSAKIHYSLNALLPSDIRILDLNETLPDFHARYSAISKEYHYHLCLDSVQSPFRTLHSLHIKKKIDLELLKQASQLFLGTHDFTSFANEAHRGVAAHDPVRTMIKLEPIQQEDGIRLEFRADGFLYKMVRNIVGVLLDVGSRQKPLEQISHLLQCKDRRQAGYSAPAHGLFLMDVEYPSKYR